MQNPLHISLSLAGTAALALAAIPFGIRPVSAQEAKAGNAVDLGVMGVSLKDAIQPNFGFQGALQGAGTPNQAGIGGFLPLVTGYNSSFFLDAQANVKHRDVRVQNFGNSTCGGCGFGETGVGMLAPDPEQTIGYQGAT